MLFFQDNVFVYLIFSEISFNSLIGKNVYKNNI